MKSAKVATCYARRLHARQRLTSGMKPSDKRRYRIAAVVLAVAKEQFVEYSRFYNVDTRAHVVIRQCVSHILAEYEVGCLDNAFAVGAATHTIIRNYRDSWFETPADYVFGSVKQMGRFGEMTKAEIEAVIRESMIRHGIAEAVKDWVPYEPENDPEYVAQGEE